MPNKKKVKRWLRLNPMQRPVTLSHSLCDPGTHLPAEPGENTRCNMSHDKNADHDPSIISGKALERHFDLRDALSEYAKLFDYEEKNDRAIAIVGATFLEILLEHILWAFLIDDEKEVTELLQYDQPLGTFSGKIRMTYCLGLIYKPVRDDLHLVRKIRNEFAHNLYASFEGEKIKSWRTSLQWHKKAYVADPPPNASARDLFYVGVHRLVTYPDGVVCIAGGEKRIVKQVF